MKWSARAALLASAAAALAFAAACGHTPGDSAAAGAPAISGARPALQTPVGPVPGPAENPPGRENPYRNDRAAQAEGRQLFVRFNCSGCHGGRAGGGMGPSLRDVDWIYGATDAQVFSSIAEGRAHGMPAWGTSLNDDQVWKLVAYIKSLRTPTEPDAPQ
ncbi:MAG TPA: c-type cytochrome [Vicinamibacterales bacterium]|nr:c-type cytochrome [Vicinamibacterales bacterium]